jgi:hypothetical protein
LVNHGLARGTDSLREGRLCEAQTSAQLTQLRIVLIRHDG